MADNETYLIPIDHADFNLGAVDKQLIFDIICGKQNKILTYDYKELEETYEHIENLMKERFRDYIQREHIQGVVLEEDEKKRKY